MAADGGHWSWFSAASRLSSRPVPFGVTENVGCGRPRQTKASRGLAARRPLHWGRLLARRGRAGRRVSAAGLLGSGDAGLQGGHQIDHLRWFSCRGWQLERLAMRLPVDQVENLHPVVVVVLGG